MILRNFCNGNSQISCFVSEKDCIVAALQCCPTGMDFWDEGASYSENKCVPYVVVFCYKISFFFFFKQKKPTDFDHTYSHKDLKKGNYIHIFIAVANIKVKLQPLHFTYFKVLLKLVWCFFHKLCMFFFSFFSHKETKQTCHTTVKVVCNILYLTLFTILFFHSF